ncbi:MAG: shikimate kinase [Paludibacteraceae bacterium]|nr:shikimate kinase [Paludibacteraceae bacterium]
MQTFQSTSPMQLPIYLIGYMAAGKTTVGRLLAERLGWRFVDLDEAFAEIHSQTPAEYIREHGIEAFRYKEKYVVEDLAELPFEKVIYATGGGYPCWEDNMECLKELGTSIYLKWKPEHLAQRLMLTDLSTRPVLQGRSEEELLAFITPQLQAREPYYMKADYVIEAPVKDIAAEDDKNIAEQLWKLISYKTK